MIRVVGVLSALLAVAVGASTAAAQAAEGAATAVSCPATVAELTRRHPDASFTLVLGLDAFRDIHGWHRWDELLASCDLAVTSRPPERVVEGRDALSAAGLPIAVQEAFWYDENQACHRHRSGRRLDFHPLTALDISSTTIRRLVREGRSIRFLTEASVVDWIEARGLYRT